MKKTVERSFVSHILCYIGIGLISGSIVHMGTLTGNEVRYVILIVLGIIAFIIGTLLEKEKAEIGLVYILVSVALAIGVGMVSGGTQHYLDGPVYAAFLIPIGLLVGYVAYVELHDKVQLTLKKVALASIISFGLLGMLYGVAHSIPVVEDHHGRDVQSH